MLNIIVKDQGVIVGKEVYSGDDNASRAAIEEKRKKNPQLEYIETEDAVFSVTETAPVETKEETDWQVAKGKGLEAMVLFIAKQLELE